MVQWLSAVAQLSSAPATQPSLTFQRHLVPNHYLTLPSPNPSPTYISDVTHLGPREHLLRRWIDLVMFSLFSNKAH